MQTTTSTPSDTHAITDDSDQREVLACGTRVGPWQIEAPLGAGGAGDVYAVVHADIRKRAALKILRGRLAGGLCAERIQLEGQIANRVQHPGIVDVFDGGTFRGRPYLVMERLDGVTLGALMERVSIGPALAIEILQQLCGVLAAAHGAGIIHRDLKPENIFLLDTGAAVPQLKLIDWGIAKVLDDGSRRTMEGQLIGSPDYLSPEQACGRPISASTDVYSLGVLAYQLFCHRLPFVAESAADVLRMHVHAPAPSPRAFWRDIPPSLEQLLIGMLTKDPGQRPELPAVIRTLELIADEVLRGPDPLCASPADSTDDTGTGFAPTVHAGVTLAGSLRPSLGWPLTTVLAFAVVASTSLVMKPAGEHARAVRAAAAIIEPEPATATLGTWIATAEAALPSLVEIGRALGGPVSARRDAAPSPRAAPAPPPRRMKPAPRLHLERRRLTRAVGTALADAVTGSRAPARITAAALAEKYVFVGRALARNRGTVEVNDLWSRYRLVRINEAVATLVRREQAANVLTGIESELARRAAHAPKQLLTLGNTEDRTPVRNPERGVVEAP